MKILILTISLFLSFGLGAQKVSTDAVYQTITSEYTLNEDGSVDFHYYKKIKLNTHFSFNRLYGETFIVYNPAYQNLTINTSQTTHENGNVFEGPFNSFNEVLPRFASNAPYYNGLREMVVTHPGLEVGAVVELDYTLSTQPGFYPGLMDDLILTESSPVLAHKVIVHVPTGKTLQFQVMNVDCKPEVKEDKSSTTYTFNFSELKESTHESNQPKDQLDQPRVYFSTMAFEEAIAKVTSQEAFKYTVDKSMKTYVEKLKAENTDEVKLILAIQKMVAGEINTYGIPPHFIGYTMRPATETWKSNGGTPCEKTILMAALLREAGINANPVMVIPSKLYEADNGCLPLAENFLLQVNPQEREQMYISAVKSADQNLVYALNDRTILLFEPSKQYVESIHESFDNKVITNGDFVVFDDFTFTGTMETSLTEETNPYYAFLNDSAHIKSLIGGSVSKKDIIASSLVNSAQFRTLAQLTVEAKTPPADQAGYIFWDIPVNKKGADNWHIIYLNGDRTAPFEIPNAIDEQYSFNVVLPANVQLINPVELTELKADFGKLVLSTQQKDNKVQIKRMLVINKTLISQEDYPAFKEMMDLWNEKNFRKLILR